MCGVVDPRGTDHSDSPIRQPGLRASRAFFTTVRAVNILEEREYDARILGAAAIEQGATRLQ